jgi:hypothetical protein
MAMPVNKPFDTLVKPLTKFVMYLEECLLSVKTCKAFQKMKRPHLWAFHFQKCLVLYFSGVQIGYHRKKNKNEKLSIFTPCNALGCGDYWNQLCIV